MEIWCVVSTPCLTPSRLPQSGKVLFLGPLCLTSTLLPYLIIYEEILKYGPYMSYPFLTPRLSSFRILIYN